MVYFLFGIAILADVLANDKPLFAVYKGTVYFPVFKQYLVDLRIDRWSSDLVMADWKDLDHAGDVKTAIWPPIRYSESDEDLRIPFHLRREHICSARMALGAMCSPG